MALSSPLLGMGVGSRVVGAGGKKCYPPRFTARVTRELGSQGIWANGRGGMANLVGTCNTCMAVPPSGSSYPNSNISSLFFTLQRWVWATLVTCTLLACAMGVDYSTAAGIGASTLISTVSSCTYMPKSFNSGADAIFSISLVGACGAKQRDINR